jgi:predicted nucleotidyltransferase
MITEPDVAWVVERIVALYDPDQIYVFGSYAKGTAHEKSDLDLLVVRPSELPQRQRGQDVIAILRNMPIDFDVLFVTPDELAEEVENPYSLLSTVMANARTLYERAP